MPPIGHLFGVRFFSKNQSANKLPHSKKAPGTAGKFNSLRNTPHSSSSLFSLKPKKNKVVQVVHVRQRGKTGSV